MKYLLFFLSFIPSLIFGQCDPLKGCENGYGVYTFKTGGFRSVWIMEKALEDGHLDVVGLARPFCLYPNLANLIFNGSVTRFNTPIPMELKIKLR